jgi:hypothetical protein
MTECGIRFVSRVYFVGMTNVIEITIAYEIVNMNQRRIQGVGFLNVPLTSLPATPYVNSSKSLHELE